MERAGLFVDIANLFNCVQQVHDGARLDFEKYLAKCREHYEVVRAFAYGTQIKEEATKFIHKLKHLGYDVKYNRPRVIRNTDGEIERVNHTDWSVGLTVDIIRNLQRLDVVIFGSSNRVLVPCVNYLKERGIK